LDGNRKAVSGNQIKNGEFSLKMLEISAKTEIVKIQWVNHRHFNLGKILSVLAEGQGQHLVHFYSVQPGKEAALLYSVIFDCTELSDFQVVNRASDAAD